VDGGRLRRTKLERDARSRRASTNEVLMKRPNLTACALCFAFGSFVVGAEAPGFYLTGLVSATPTEHSEQMIGIGNDIAIIVKDKAIFERQVEPLIGKTVRFCLVEP
jgi:hypothetical protein